MNKKLEGVSPSSGKGVSLSARLEFIRQLNERCSARRRAIPIQPIAEALIADGYVSLDEQAKALGLHRSTVWTIVKNKHKLGHLNTKTTERILENPETPTSVLMLIEQYIAPLSKRA